MKKWAKPILVVYKNTKWRICLMDLEGIGIRIRKKRLSKSMTQEELAERTNLTVAYIGMIEREERTPSLETFIQIANELNATADELLCETLQKGYLLRLQKYEEKFSTLNRKELKKVYAVMDALLEMP